MPDIPSIKTWLANPEMDINGLAPCPWCGITNQVRMRNRWCDDGITRYACFMCQNCGFTGPDIPFNPPVPWQETGSVAFSPFRDAWNTYVESLSGAKPTYNRM